MLSEGRAILSLGMSVNLIYKEGKLGGKAIIGREAAGTHFNQEREMFDILWAAQRPCFCLLLRQDYELALFCLTLSWP